MPVLNIKLVRFETVDTLSMKTFCAPSRGVLVLRIVHGRV